MMKKVLALATSVVAALAVVGVAWAGTNDGTSTSVTSADVSTSSTGVTVTSVDDTSPTTGATVPEDTTATTARVGTTSTSEEGRSSSSSSSSSTSTSIATSTSTSNGENSTTSTSMGSSTSTSIDDSDGSNVADEVTTHNIPGVGKVTVEVFQGVLYLSSVSAPGWDIERDEVGPDRIELEFTSGEAKAEFEARLRAGGVDIKIEVDTD